MTPGTVVRANDLLFLVLYPTRADGRIACTALSEDAYIDHNEVITVVEAASRQYYLVPGIALLAEETLQKLEQVDTVDEQITASVAYDPFVQHQVVSLLRSTQPNQQGPVPD